jgi:hypothetical protein
MSERDDYQSLMRNNLAYRIKIEANRKEIERLTAENERMKEGIYEIGQISFHPRIMELNEQQLRIKFEDIRARASCLYDKQALGDALKEQVEKQEAALKEIKQIARTASRHEIFGIANDALGDEALGKEKA